MQHKRATKHSFFRLKQIRRAIQNRITRLICLNARKLTMFCHTLFYYAFVTADFSEILMVPSTKSAFKFLASI